MRLVDNPERELTCVRAHRDIAGFLCNLLVYETGPTEEREERAKLMRAHALNLETIADDLVKLAEKEEEPK